MDGNVRTLSLHEAVDLLRARLHDRLRELQDAPAASTESRAAFIRADEANGALRAVEALLLAGLASR